MDRNLVVCCDGTNNQFGTNNTNVVRLVEVLDRDSGRQRVYYDPGVGTLPEPGWGSAIGQRFSEVLGLAFGSGVVHKVGLAYSFLMQHWRPGDRVYLFGFSRGAYCVRALAALLHMYGLLQAGNENLLPYVLRMFKASRRKLGKSDASAREFWELCDAFRETFAQAVPSRVGRRFPIHFMGVWDTVSSVGWVWDPLKFPFTKRNPSIQTIRHAVSLDERRAFFRQNQFEAVSQPGQDLLEVWFPGVHADVGGGYPESEGGLWREPYRWILEEARHSGLIIDERRAAHVWNRLPVPERIWCEPAHESLTWKWLPAEIFPKLAYRGPNRRRLPKVNLGRPRRIPVGAFVHASAQRREEDAVPPYRSRALAAVGRHELRIWPPLMSAPVAASRGESDEGADLLADMDSLRESASPSAVAERDVRGWLGEVADGGGDDGAGGSARDSYDIPDEDVKLGPPPTRSAAPRATEETTADEVQARYLQAQIREINAQRRAQPASWPLQRERSYLAAVRVGVPSDEWADAGVAAPVPRFVDDRPQQFDVFFQDIERGSIEKKSIWLPPAGNSSECEFSFKPLAHGEIFHARIVLCHRGRILQAALLRVPIGVIADPRHILLLDIAAPAVADESERRVFDVALSLDRLGSGDLTGMVATQEPSADGRPATVVRVSQTTLNNVVTGMAGAIRQHVNPQPGQIAIDSPQTLTLLRKLAIHGSTLYEEVIRPAKLANARKPGLRLSIACSAESYFPAEIVYDRPVPIENAGLCDGYRTSLLEGTCCGQWQTRGGEVICPLGFWGLSCVIERKCGAQGDLAPPPPDQFALMYRAARLEGGLRIGQPALLAASDAASKVDTDMAKELLAALRETHNIKSDSVDTWAKWIAGVAALTPDVLVLVPHHVRDESALEYLQIGAESKADFESNPNYLNSRRVTQRHVLAGVDASAPVVLLIGCDTTQARVAFENFVIAFERAGAASVVGTTAPIIGRHAGPVVRRLMQALREKPAAGATLGDVLLQAKRNILLDGYPMVMCLATYGGADHRLEG